MYMLVTFWKIHGAGGRAGIYSASDQVGFSQGGERETAQQSCGVRVSTYITLKNKSSK